MSQRSAREPFTARLGATLKQGIADLNSLRYTELVTNVDPTPNGMEIGKRFLEFLRAEKRKANSGVVILSGNSFTLRTTGPNAITRETIVKKLHELDAKKRDV